MSMISGLIDELNKSADEWNSSNMFELARMCREAADTIWQLRDDLQQANAENAKLRELAERAWKTAERICQAFDGPCRDDGVTIYKPCPLGERDEECVYGLLQRDLRGLGVEVE